MTMIQVSYQGPMGPLVLTIDGHMKKTFGSLMGLKGTVCTRIRSEKSCTCCRLGYYCSNITIHGNKGANIKSKASRSVIELSIENIVNLYFW